MKRSTTYALFAAMTAIGAASAGAQSIPEGQSCGGLLCDMGIFGHKTVPAASTPVPPAPGPAAVRRADAASPPAMHEPALREPRKRTIVKKKVAKVIAPAAAPVNRPAASAPVRTATQVQAKPSKAPVPPATAVSVSVNPFVQSGPVSTQFRPLY